jgi:hypothetical protein
MSVSALAIHEVLPQNTMMKILSYQNYYDLSHFLCASKSVRFLREASDNSLERSLFSRVEIFDRTKWNGMRNAEIAGVYDADKIEICRLRAFHVYYYGPNPVGPGTVKDHCLTPTVVPNFLAYQGKPWVYCLRMAEILAENPQKGPPVTFVGDSTGVFNEFALYGIENNELAIYLKGAFEQGESWEAQVQFLDNLKKKTGYEFPIPDLLSQVTVQLAHFQLTGERAFGDATGMEGKVTCCNTRDQIVEECDSEDEVDDAGEGKQKGYNIFQASSGCFCGEGASARGTYHARLHIVDDNFFGCHTAIAVCRKF